MILLFFNGGGLPAAPTENFIHIVNESWKTPTVITESIGIPTVINERSVF